MAEGNNLDPNNKNPGAFTGTRSEWSRNFGVVTGDAHIVASLKQDSLQSFRLRGERNILNRDGLKSIGLDVGGAFYAAARGEQLDVAGRQASIVSAQLSVLADVNGLGIDLIVLRIAGRRSEDNIMQIRALPSVDAAIGNDHHL